MSGARTRPTGSANGGVPMLARGVTRAPDHREPLRVVLLGLMVAATVTFLTTMGARAAPQQPASSPVPSAPALEAFASGGASSDVLGVRVAEDGRFALRAEVVDALHSTLRVSLDGQAYAVDVVGVRIVGLYRGAHDLTTLQGARVLILGRCTTGMEKSLLDCSAESVEVQFGRPRPVSPADAPADA